MNITNTGKVIALFKNILDTNKRTISPIRFETVKPELYESSEPFFGRATPEECGIDSRTVCKYINELLDDKSIGFQNIMMLRNRKVFFEASKGNRQLNIPRTTFSQCKSIVSLAIGVLVTQGRLGLNEKLTDIFAERMTPISKIKMKGITVRHLLSMTSTVLFNEFEAMVSRDWVKEFLDSDTEGIVGTDFRYNSLNTYMLSAIIKERTGVSLSEFLDETLFGALGITNYYWEKCPAGIEKGGWGLYILPEDIAKLGVLVMQGGVWNGKRLISAKYIIEATKTQAVVPKEYGGFNYGYQIWSGRSSNSFLFNGLLGQNLLGYRESGIIIAVNCGNCDTFQQGAFFEISDRYFNRYFPEKAETDKDGSEELLRLKAAMQDDRFGCKRSFLPIRENSRNLEDDLNAIDGRRFAVEGANAASAGFAPMVLQMVQGNYTKGLKEIEFFRKDKGLSIAFTEQDETHEIAVGFGSPEKSVAVFHGEPFNVLSEGRFTENEDGVPVLLVNCEFTETPYSRRYKFFFDCDDIRAEFSEQPAEMLPKAMPKIFSTLMPKSERLGTAFSKLDNDYISLRFEKAFAQKLKLSEIIKTR